MGLVRAIVFLLFIGMLSFLAFAQDSIDLSQSPVEVSLIQLIANPSDYDGKLVQVVAFFNSEPESNALYLHQDDYNYGIHRNGIWINLEEQTSETIEMLNNNYVFAVGTFKAEDKGFLDMWSGSLTKIVLLRIFSRIEE